MQIHIHIQYKHSVPERLALCVPVSLCPPGHLTSKMNLPWEYGLGGSLSSIRRLDLELVPV